MIPIDIVDRIFALADERFEEQRHFAAAVDVTPSIASEWRRRKSSSFSKKLPKIAEALGTTVDYLLTGEQKETTSVSEGGDLGPEHLALIDAVKNMDTETAKATLEVVNSILKLRGE